jgi:hypothetical protein
MNGSLLAPRIVWRSEERIKELLDELLDKLLYELLDRSCF